MQVGGLSSEWIFAVVIDVAVATCSQLPNLDPDDVLLVKALEQLNARVTPAIWNNPGEDWRSFGLCLVRSTWDYHKDPHGFLSWIDNVSTMTTLLNGPEILRWNSHKFYLRDLEKAGASIVPTFWLQKRDEVDLSELMEWLDWPEAVIKPAHGASADGVQRVGPNNRELAQEYLVSLLERQDVLIQPYLNTISTYHERALVFVAGEFSHAVSKMPFMHAGADLAKRASLPPGSSGEVPVAATADEIAAARRALDASPSGHVFARVDLVNDGLAPRVLEVEMIEPTLYLYANPPAAEKLAKAVVGFAESTQL